MRYSKIVILYLDMYKSNWFC